MKANSMTATVLAVALAMAASTASAAKPAEVVGHMSPQQRGQAIRQFVLKWGAYVEHTYGLDSRTWAMRLVPQFASGDSSNVRAALQRQTYEGALAELDGRGHRLSDDRVITKMASQPVSASAPPASELLGDTTNDLVYTPITPCRIADTRNMGAGAIAQNTSRDFGAWGWGSYTAWGGSATDCGMLNEHPTAVVLNVTAVTPAGAGYATVYGGDLASPPLVASVNYAAGAIVNNSVVANINPGSSPDFKIYSYAQSHYVVDIVGFYDSPHATPLGCTTVTSTAVSIAANTYGSVSHPACPTGYTKTGGDCYGGSGTAMYLMETGPNVCVYRNLDTSAHNATATTTCCRVPGR